MSNCALLVPGDIMCTVHMFMFEEEFEDTEGVIRMPISKKNRQRNGQEKKYKRTNNNL